MGKNMQDKSAMQQMIDWMKKEADEMATIDAPIMGRGQRGYQLTLCIKKATELLEVEKKNIVEAYDDGRYNGSGTGNINDLEQTGDEYYSTKFNQNENKETS